MNYIDTNVENWCYDSLHPSPMTNPPWKNHPSATDATPTPPRTETDNLIDNNCNDAP